MCSFEMVTMKLRSLKNSKGVAFIELAIVLPLLLIILFEIAELTLCLYDKAMITNASREGARAGVVYSIPPVYNNNGYITSVVNTYLGNNLITFGGSSGATVNSTPVGGSPGGQLTVTVKYAYNFLVLPRLVTSVVGPINLTAVTTMRIE